MVIKIDVEELMWRMADSPSQSVRTRCPECNHDLRVSDWKSFEYWTDDSGFLEQETVQCPECEEVLNPFGRREIIYG